LLHALAETISAAVGNSLLVSLQMEQRNNPALGPPEWLNSVSGISDDWIPVDKHILLWPELFEEFERRVHFQDISLA